VAAPEKGICAILLGDAAFLSALAEHSPFGAASQAAVLEEADYDLAARLSDLVRIRALAAMCRSRKPASMDSGHEMEKIAR
jgi:hypothetical protein